MLRHTLVRTGDPSPAISAIALRGLRTPVGSDVMFYRKNRASEVPVRIQVWRRSTRSQNKIGSRLAAAQQPYRTEANKAQGKRHLYSRPSLANH